MNCNACGRRPAFPNWASRRCWKTSAKAATEAQLCGIASAAMLANGAEATGYPIWCCSGPNSTPGHQPAHSSQSAKGEVIHFSIGAKVAGYSASVGRPVVLGSCPDDLKSFLQVGLDAMTMTIDLMRAGTISGEVARKVHGWIADQGYGHTILYGPAHGCGQMECEFPFLESSSTFTLMEDMAFMVDVFLADETAGLSLGGRHHCPPRRGGRALKLWPQAEHSGGLKHDHRRARPSRPHQSSAFLGGQRPATRRLPRRGEG